MTEAPGSGVLMVGNIAVKLLKNKGIIGGITPYVVRYQTHLQARGVHVL